MAQGKCSQCDDYKKQGHNYCCMCGFHLTKGYVQHVRLTRAYNVNEKFCGYCGGPKQECSCRQSPSGEEGDQFSSEK